MKAVDHNPMQILSNRLDRLELISARLTVFSNELTHLVSEFTTAATQLANLGSVVESANHAVNVIRSFTDNVLARKPQRRRRSMRSRIKLPKGKIRGSGKPPKLERGFRPPSKTKSAERLRNKKL